MKDRQAVTRQIITIHAPGRRPEDFPALEHPRVRILGADLHKNKLRRGHLAGNRFVIRVRDVTPGAAPTALRALKMLQTQGLPDRVGEQRFGYLANNHLIGRALLQRRHDDAAHLLLDPNPRAPESQHESRDLFSQGKLDDAARAFPRRFTFERRMLTALAAGITPEQAFDEADPTVLSYYLSAFQSATFNTVLDRRLDDGTFATLIEGDIALTNRRRGSVRVDDVLLADPTTAEKVARFELSPSGPMWGYRMPRTSGAVDELEVEALAHAGVSLRDLEAARDMDAKMIGGTRRPLRVPVRNADVEFGADEHGPYLRCAFDLPAGAFATSVMGEIMKPTNDSPTPETEDRQDDADHHEDDADHDEP